MDDVLKTIIAEAAGEGEEGMYWVGSVIANRAKRRGRTPAQIVNQPYQFTGRARLDLDKFIARQPPEVIAAAQRAWQRAQQDPVPGIDHYLTSSLLNSSKRPSWATKMGVVKEVGGHTFLDSRIPMNRPAGMKPGAKLMTPMMPPDTGEPDDDESLEKKLFRMDRLVRGVFGTEMSPLELRRVASQIGGGGQTAPPEPEPNMGGFGGGLAQGATGALPQPPRPRPTLPIPGDGGMAGGLASMPIKPFSMPEWT